MSSETEMSLDELEEIVREFHDLGGFKMGSAAGILGKKVISLFIKNIRMMRGCFLMDLFASDNSKLFSSTKVPGIFHNIYNQPPRATARYPQVFIQTLGYHIRQIYEKPLDLANAVSSFFKKDTAGQNYFAYSTFPAIFSYFLGQEFSRSASLFLIGLMYESKDYLFIENLIESYFKAVPIFYTRLWASLTEAYSQFPREFDNEFLFTHFTACLTSSLCHLTEFHVNVFASYAMTFPTRVAAFLVDRLFSNRFNAAAVASKYLPHPGFNKILTNFFTWLKKSDQKIKVQRLINIIRDHKRFLDVIPSMNCSIWSHGIPFILCDFDLSILTDILKSSPDFKYTPQSDLNITHGFDAYLMEIFPIFDFSQDELICQSLFNKSPPNVVIEDDDNYSRLYRAVQMEAKRNSMDVYALINDPKYNLSLINDKSFRKYCLKSILNEYLNNYETLETSFLLAEHESRQRDLKSAIDDNMQTLFIRFAGSYIRRKVLKNRHRIDDSLSTAMQKIVGTDQISSHNYFAIGCTALDSINVSINTKFEGPRKFLALSNDWLEKIWPTHPCQEYIRDKMVRIMNLASRLAHLGELKYGKRLVLILDFVKSLISLCDKQPKKYLLPMIHISMMNANASDILISFLFLHHNMFSTSVLTSRWGRKVVDTWNMFALAVWDIMKDDTGLLTKCNSAEFIHSIYKIN